MTCSESIMVWYVFAFLGAIFDSTFYMLSKQLLKTIDQYVLASGVFLSSFFVLLLISIFQGIPDIGAAFYQSVFVTGILNVVAAILYYKALKMIDLSLSIPMISFTPIFLVFTSFFLLNEFPTAFGIVGIFLIVVGSYILNTTKNSKHLLDPFKEIFTNRAILYMLIVAFLFSISANFDKIVVKNSDPYFGHSMVFLLIGGCFFGISVVNHKGFFSYQRDFHKIFFIGLILALEAITINIAYTMQIVPYVISIKRISILFSVFYGGLIFREKNIFMRIAGASVMTIGVILIILSDGLS